VSGLNITEVRERAKAHGIEARDRGRVPAALASTFRAAAAQQGPERLPLVRALESHPHAEMGTLPMHAFMHRSAEISMFSQRSYVAAAICCATYSCDNRARSPSMRFTIIRRTYLNCADIKSYGMSSSRQLNDA
jgi:hypothetical protein